MIAWFVRNGVAANLTMLLIIVGGGLSLLNMKMELFPDFEFDIVTVRVAYPGATPEEVEESICIKIEEEMQDLEGIKEMTSTSNEGLGVVTIEVDPSYDAREMLSDVESRVNAINTFPTEVEKPIVSLPSVASDILSLAIYGKADEDTLKRIAERTRKEILALPGISRIDIFGARDYEVSIELNEEALQRYGLVFSDVTNAVRLESLDVPGGTVREDGGEILLRTVGQAYRQEEFENIPIITREDGSRLVLKDVARVIDGFTDEPMGFEFNGFPAVALRVYEVGDENTLDISAKVKEFVEQNQHRMPEGVQMQVWADGAFYLQGRLNMLVENGIFGLVLVFGLLALFLRPSLAIWVTLGIPVSFLGAFFLMPFADVSINIISLFGLILVLGIVVDDAIVVGESVFSEFQKRGGSGVEASIAGSHAVAVPVTFAVITTAVAFVPILFIPGFQGKIMEPIPYVVIATLLFSLVESKLILPYHLTLCRVGGSDRKQLNFFQRFQRRIADGLESFIQNRYKPILFWALSYRYAVLALFIGALFVTIGLLLGGHISFTPFPNPPSDYVTANLEMVEGTPESKTRKVLDRMHQAWQEVSEDLAKEGITQPIEYAAVAMGSQPFAGGPHGSNSILSAPNKGQLTLELQKSEDRLISAPEFERLWRKKIGQIPGVKELSIISKAAGGSAKDISIQITGMDFEHMKAAAIELKEALGEFTGVYGIMDDFLGGKREIVIKVRPEAEVLGLTQRALGEQVRAAFYGEEAQRVQRGREDLRVMIRYPKEDRDNISTLEKMRIRTPQGKEVPFYEVASVEMGRGPSTISRIDGSRAIRIEASLDPTENDINNVKLALKNEVMPSLLEKYPSVTWEFKGRIGDNEKSVNELAKGAIMVMFVIYFLMAIPFKSYIQPLIVMSAIPFGLIGAVFGHVVFGYIVSGQSYSISILSLTGMLAMAGVLVNDSLVLVDYVNRQVRAGVDKLKAVRQAGLARFRPILLTSLTTFVGLTPILMERSLQAQFLIPMAISLAFGVLFGTFITLVLIPSCYLILEDIARLFVLKSSSSEQVPPGYLEARSRFLLSKSSARNYSKENQK